MFFKCKYHKKNRENVEIVGYFPYKVFFLLHMTDLSTNLIANILIDIFSRCLQKTFDSSEIFDVCDLTVSILIVINKY